MWAISVNLWKPVWIRAWRNTGLHYKSTVLFWKKKTLPAENKWIWAKWPVWISLAEIYRLLKVHFKLASICFSPFLLLFYNSSLQLSSEAMKYKKLFYSSYPTIAQFSTRYRLSFMDSTNFLFEWLPSNWRSKDAASTYERPENYRETHEPLSRGE